MTFDQVADNFRKLRDEALLLKDGMDYPSAIQSAEFCTRAIAAFDEAAEKYGDEIQMNLMPYSGFSVDQLSLADIYSLDQQKNIMDNLEKCVHMHSMTYHSENSSSASSKLEYENAREKIGNALGDENWPSKLFSHKEIIRMAHWLETNEPGPQAVFDKVNGAISKSFAQNEILKQIKEEIPVEEICSSLSNLCVLDNNPDGSYNRWLMDQFESIQKSFWNSSGFKIYSDLNCQRFDDTKKRCIIAANPNAIFPGLDADDKLLVTSYCSAVSSSLARESLHRKQMKEMSNGKFESFTRPIIKFLKATGMDEDKILHVFDGMRQSAEKILGKSAGMER